MLQLLFIVSLLLAFGQATSAQPAGAQDDLSEAFPDSAFIVNSITVTGNEDTKEFVILREMTLKPGSLITHEALEYNKNRIYSLGLFNKVEMEIEPTSGTSANLTVRVYERWFLYPYPIFGIRYRDWSKLYYGFGLMHINFRGRNEKLFASFAFGFDPWVSLAYRNPFLDEGGKYFLESGLTYNKIKSKSEQIQKLFGDIEEEHFTFSAGAGKRFDTRHTLRVNFGYRVVEAAKLQSNNTVLSYGADRFPQVTVGYSYDTRDLFEYPAYGTYASLGVTKFGAPSSSIDFTHFNADLRRYLPLGSSLVLTGRAFTALTAGGEKPIYENVFFGYGDRIRGHFNEVFEGENLLGVSSELHYELMKPVYVNVDFLPKEFSIWRFAVSAALFVDAGKVWFRGDTIDMKHIPSGYGGGLHFLLPFSFVLRTEYAWNELGKSQFIFDFGASF